MHQLHLKCEPDVYVLNREILNLGRIRSANSLTRLVVPDYQYHLSKVVVCPRARSQHRLANLHFVTDCQLPR